MYSIEQNLVNSNKFATSLSFCAGPSLPGLATGQSCGKPSTKFPHGGLVECLFIQHTSYLSLLSYLKISNFQFFHVEMLIFRNCPKPWNIIGLVVALRFWCFNTPILIFIIARQGFLYVFLKVIEQNIVNSTKFEWYCTIFRVPNLASLTIVFVWQSCGQLSIKFLHRGLEASPLPTTLVFLFWKLKFLIFF